MSRENRATTPSSLEQALAEQAEALEREIAADTRQKQLEIVKRALAEMEAVRKGTTPKPPPPRPQATKSDSFRRASSLPQAAEFALEDEGHPMTPSEMLPLISRYGRAVGGEKPSWNVSNAMSAKRTTFMSVEWGGKRCWWLVGKPIPKEVS